MGVEAVSLVITEISLTILREGGTPLLQSIDRNHHRAKLDIRVCVCVESAMLRLKNNS